MERILSHQTMTILFFKFLPGPPPLFFWCQQLKGIIITSKQTIPEKNNNKKETPYRENRHTEIVSDCRPNNFSELESEFSKNIFWMYLFNWKTNDGPGKLTSTQIVCFFFWPRKETIPVGPTTESGATNRTWMTQRDWRENPCEKLL